MIYGMMNASRGSVDYDYDCGKFSVIPRWDLRIRIDDSDEATKRKTMSKNFDENYR
jgi:hypothetical protein